MANFLLDTNVLIALFWPTHISHKAAQRWFLANGGDGWATCPLTQCGFVRIVSNPGFSLEALTPEKAIRLLRANIEHRSHRFWPDVLSLADALEAAGLHLQGHQQITDAYLVGLAARHRGKLATLGRRLAAWHSPHVEMI